MDMGHLYHDSYFTSRVIELAVKEKLKTREVNAREDRALKLTSQNFQRAKLICEKNQSFEKWKVGQALRRIRDRSPGLDRSLAEEKARVEELQRDLLSRSCLHCGQDISEDKLSNRISPDLNARPVLSVGKRKSQRRKDKPLNTELGRDMLKQADYVKRSEHTVKVLARLGWRQDQRRLDHRQCKQELLAFSKPLIERASVILKGRDDIDVHRFLEEFENCIIGTDLLTADATSEESQGHPDASMEPFSASEHCHGDQKKSQLYDSLVQGSHTLLAESENTTRLTENFRNNEKCSKNPIAKPVQKNNSVRNVSSNTSDPALRLSAANQRYLPELTQELPLPPIKLENKQSSEVPDSHQPMASAESPPSSNLAKTKNLTGKRSNLAPNNNKGHNKTLSTKGPVWLPQLWRQHKKRVFHSSTLPVIRRRRKKLHYRDYLVESHS